MSAGADTATPGTFLVPDLGEGLEDATIVAWHVGPGDRVELNAPLCTLETAKAEVEIPSPFAGEVVELGGEQGDVLDVGSVLVRIEVAPADLPAPTGEVGASDGPGPSDDPGASGDVLVGYGTDHRRGAAQRRRAAPPPPHVRGRARRRSDRPIPPSEETYTDTTRTDTTRTDTTQSGEAAGDGPAGAGTRSGATAEEAEEVAVTGVRARIASHMVRAHSETPTAAAQREVDCTRIMQLRGAWDAELVRRGAEASITPFAAVAWIAARVLARHRWLNATYVPADPARPSSRAGPAGSTGARIRRHDEVHLGIATATDTGLVVPVLRSAQRMGLGDFASTLAALTGDARDRRLAPADMVGSTATITNFGALGLDAGVPVINHPEALILGVGRIAERAVVIDSQVVARHTTSVTVVFDHRVADGAEVGSFMADLAAAVEEPALLGL